MATTPASVPLLHRFLGLGLVFAAAVFLLLRSRGIPALLDDVAMRVVFAYSFSGVAFVVTAIGLLFLKPRVPERPGGQSVEQYWSTPEVAGKALAVWFVLEAAGMLAGVGYLLTGQTVVAVVMVLTIGVFWLCGPNVFAKP